MRLSPAAPLLLTALAGLALAACDGDRTVRISTSDRSDKPKGVLRVVETLQCPEAQGQLTRKGAATDGGTTCWYVGPRGASVQLRLVRLDGKATDGVLKAVEEELRADLPRAEGGEAAEGDRSTPTISVQAEGDTADIRIGGFRIQAKDGDKREAAAEGEAEAVSVQHGADGAEIRVRGGGTATRATWILTDARHAGEGWRLVGYEARGPEGGPLVVAVVRSKDESRDETFDDAVDLVSLNVGD